MEETISLQEIVAIIRKRLGLIILLTIGAALISGVVTTFFMTPIYESSTQFLVNQNQAPNETEVSGVELNDLRTNVELINTYNVIIQSDRILSEVQEELGLNISTTALSNKLTVDNENDSQVVTVSATDPDPEMAVQIVNTTVGVFQDQIGDLMNVDNVNVLNEAQVPLNPSPISPNTMLNIAIAGVLGLMVGVGLAFLLDFLDTTVKTEEDVEKDLGLPVIGIVSHISDRDIATPSPQSVRPVRERRQMNGQAKKTS
ncbi:Capsular polysaccharide biosynthesis protein [Pelagirhabdus alkalitolerans]|uniref:Capsular polysaccharide biosynthesis protein n=1 Tax=Pelagirhabdus alkalitolerans TaxID=1612202 RepID=A0A1G6GH01_9BACI|nr:Wzz/FepE/Etk N-terminal domain-containing protein [Pelagirhabdus alkalitolerans]SDB81169.1 Capsular polysaccharide biosynthesis protein [Pelagirhabdus alkalitolerans]